MLSGFRSVVENLAHPQPHPSRLAQSDAHDSSSEQTEQQNAHTTMPFDLSSMTSVTNSTGHLAESALSNLRKSLSVQRAVLTSSESSHPSAIPPKQRETKLASKPTLEDRLRATFTIGEVSPATTPDPHSHAPTPNPTVAQVMTAADSTMLLRIPSSVPLPDSPPDSPLASAAALTALLSSSIQPASCSPSSQAPMASETCTISKPDNMGQDIGINTFPTERYVEANIPLPSSPKPADPALSASPLSSPIAHDLADVDKLKANVTSLEEKLADACSVLNRLRMEQDAVYTVLSDLTPITHVHDVNEMRIYLESLKSQDSKSRDEIKRLNNKLRIYDDRIEELRDTHRLESRSQMDLVNDLRRQLEETNVLLKAASGSVAQAEAETRKRQADLEKNQAEAQKLKDTLKEEEEKRIKAISLLKTVRQKLVKAEKDRDEAIKEINGIKVIEQSEREKGEAERSKLKKELENVSLEKEREIALLKSHFDRELANLKSKSEKEVSDHKVQLETQHAASISNLQKEISLKDERIHTLERNLHSLTSERDSLFDQLQIRQAELESSQSLLEVQQSSVSELQFQIRELTDKNALLSEELADVRREFEYHTFKPTQSVDDSVHVLGELEKKYEGRINELSSRLNEAERDRHEIEAVLSRNLQQKTTELEVLRKLADTSAQSKEVSEVERQTLKHEKEQLERQILGLEEQVKELGSCKEQINELEDHLQRQAAKISVQADKYESEVAEAREREKQARAAIKTLREELRKVQSSAALLDKQRNPGVGYWSTATRQENKSDVLLSSPQASSSELISGQSGATPPGNSDEEVNLEYIRNVLLQFLEHENMRPHLVRVLSIILHFTPQETRRLLAKVH